MNVVKMRNKMLVVFGEPANIQAAGQTHVYTAACMYSLNSYTFNTKQQYNTTGTVSLC